MNNDYDNYGDLIASIANEKDTVFRSYSLPSRNNENTIDTFVFGGEINQPLLKGKVKGKPPEEVLENFHFKRYNAPREMRYTDEELASFRNSCEITYVHDYSEKDFYHLDDVAREKLDELSSISLRLGGVKNIYRSIDTYITAMRIVYEAWSLLADNSILHGRQEFFEYVAKGLLVSPRIPAPVLKIGSKYNADILYRYICDTSLDPKELVSQNALDIDDYLLSDDYNIENEMDILLDDQEKKYLAAYDKQSAESIEVKPLANKYIKSYDDGLKYIKRQKGKRLNKKAKRNQNDQQLVNSLFRTIRDEHYRLDMPMYHFSSIGSIVKEDNSNIFDVEPFDGSWTKQYQVDMYEWGTEYDKLDKPVTPTSYETLADVQSKEMFQELEHRNIPTLKLRRTSSDSEAYLQRKKKESTKFDKKLERRLLQRIHKLSTNTDFKKLIKRSEKELDEYQREQELELQDREKSKYDD